MDELDLDAIKKDKYELLQNSSKLSSFSWDNKINFNQNLIHKKIQYFNKNKRHNKPILDFLKRNLNEKQYNFFIKKVNEVKTENNEYDIFHIIWMLRKEEEKQEYDEEKRETMLFHQIYHIILSDVNFDLNELTIQNKNSYPFYAVGFVRFKRHRFGFNEHDGILFEPILISNPKELYDKVMDIMKYLIKYRKKNSNVEDIAVYFDKNKNLNVKESLSRYLYNLSDAKYLKESTDNNVEVIQESKEAENLYQKSIKFDDFIRNNVDLRFRLSDHVYGIHTLNRFTNKKLQYKYLLSSIRKSLNPEIVKRIDDVVNSNDSEYFKQEVIIYILKNKGYGQFYYDFFEWFKFNFGAVITNPNVYPLYMDLFFISIHGYKTFQVIKKINNLSEYFVLLIKLEKIIDSEKHDDCRFVIGSYKNTKDIKILKKHHKELYGVDSNKFDDSYNTVSIDNGVAYFLKKDLPNPHKKTFQKLKNLFSIKENDLVTESFNYDLPTILDGPITTYIKKTYKESDETPSHVRYNIIPTIYYGDRGYDDIDSKNLKKITKIIYNFSESIYPVGNYDEYSGEDINGELLEIFKNILDDPYGDVNSKIHRIIKILNSIEEHAGTTIGIGWRRLDLKNINKQEIKKFKESFLKYYSTHLDPLSFDNDNLYPLNVNIKLVSGLGKVFQFSIVIKNKKDLTPIIENIKNIFIKKTTEELNIARGLLIQFYNNRVNVERETLDNALDKIENLKKQFGDNFDKAPSVQEKHFYEYCDNILNYLKNRNKTNINESIDTFYDRNNHVDLGLHPKRNYKIDGIKFHFSPNVVRYAVLNSVHMLSMGTMHYEMEKKPNLIKKINALTTEYFNKKYPKLYYSFLKFLRKNYLHPNVLLISKLYEFSKHSNELDNNHPMVNDIFRFFDYIAENILPTASNKNIYPCYCNIHLHISVSESSFSCILLKTKNDFKRLFHLLRNEKFVEKLKNKLHLYKNKNERIYIAYFGIFEKEEKSTSDANKIFKKVIEDELYGSSNDINITESSIVNGVPFHGITESHSIVIENTMSPSLDSPTINSNHIYRAPKKETRRANILTFNFFGKKFPEFTSNAIKFRDLGAKYYFSKDSENELLTNILLKYEKFLSGGENDYHKYNYGARDLYLPKLKTFDVSYFLTKTLSFLKENVFSFTTENKNNYPFYIVFNVKYKSDKAYDIASFKKMSVRIEKIEQIEKLFDLLRGNVELNNMLKDDKVNLVEYEFATKRNVGNSREVKKFHDFIVKHLNGETISESNEWIVNKDYKPKAIIFDNEYTTPNIEYTVRSYNKFLKLANRIKKDFFKVERFPNNPKAKDINTEIHTSFNVLDDYLNKPSELISGGLFINSNLIGNPEHGWPFPPSVFLFLKNRYKDEPAIAKLFDHIVHAFETTDNRNLKNDSSYPIIAVMRIYYGDYDKTHYVNHSAYGYTQIFSYKDIKKIDINIKNNLNKFQDLVFNGFDKKIEVLKIHITYEMYNLDDRSRVVRDLKYKNFNKFIQSENYKRNITLGSKNYLIGSTLKFLLFSILDKGEIDSETEKDFKKAIEQFKI